MIYLLTFLIMFVVSATASSVFDLYCMGRIESVKENLLMGIMGAVGVVSAEFTLVSLLLS